jgi:hypothetical protein
LLYLIISATTILLSPKTSSDQTSFLIPGWSESNCDSIPKNNEICDQIVLQCFNVSIELFQDFVLRIPRWTWTIHYTSSWSASRL